MEQAALLTKFNALPEELKKQAEDFIEFLAQKSKAPKEEKPTKRPLGLAKGLVTMSPDFDEPLEEFKDYM